MEVKHAYTFRFYPTPVQEQTLARTFGCVRFAYNHMLRLRADKNYGKQSAEYTTSAFKDVAAPSRCR